MLFHFLYYIEKKKRTKTQKNPQKTLIESWSSKPVLSANSLSTRNPFPQVGSFFLNSTSQFERWNKSSGTNALKKVSISSKELRLFLTTANSLKDTELALWKNKRTAQFAITSDVICRAGESLWKTATVFTFHHRPRPHIWWMCVTVAANQVFLLLSL